MKQEESSRCYFSNLNPTSFTMSPGTKYEQLKPNATYAPWNLDQEFVSIVNLVMDKASMIDKYRLFGLYSLIEQASKLPTGDFLEIGVWRGGSAAVMIQRARSLGLNSNFYLCDTFEGVVKATQKDSKYRSGEHADTSKSIVEDLICKKLKFNNVSIFQGIFPEDTAHLIDKRATFRFCHIDVDVYQSAKDALNFVWDRLVVGGIVVFDDYGFEGCDGVTSLVEEVCRQDDRIFLYNNNGHAIFIKIR